MKKTFEKAIALMLAAILVLGIAPLGGFSGYDLLGIGASAASESDLTFELINDGTEYEVSDCNEAASGSLAIPSTYNGKPVTSIGYEAFYRCTSLESITIPDSVTSIGDWAFEACTSLESVIIGNGVTSIAYAAFHSCKALESITIPDSVTSIGDRAFEACTSLESVIIGNGVTSIGHEAFYSCSSLESITIPDSVTSIGSWAFYETALYNNASNWENGILYIGEWLINAKDRIFGACTIKNGTKHIAGSAFSGCNSLTSITIPDSVTSIGERAFIWCESLTNITIPDSVTSIGDEAFFNCSSLTSISVDSANPSYSSQDGVLFNKDKTAIIRYPAGKNGTSCEIPDSVTSIGNYAFEGCNSLTSITIPDSVTSIGSLAFAWCESLTNVTIGNGVTSIGHEAFYSCSSLESITIPDGVTSIGDWAFEACTSLESVIIGNGVTSIAYAAFYNCFSLTDITIPDSVTSIEGYAFESCKALTSITIPDSVTSIEGYAFESCKALTSITIPDSVTGIWGGAFQYCTSLGEITFGENSNLSHIGESAFRSCEALESVEIPNGVTSIDRYAFVSCTSLESVTIPDSVTRIDYGAFAGCTGLTSININANIDELVYWDIFAQAGIEGEGVAVVFGDSVTAIPGYLFDVGSENSVPNITSVDFGDSVVSIGDAAFRNCNGISALNLPDSLESIGDNAFSGCTALSTVSLGEESRLTSIGEWSFEHCTSLESVTVSDSVTDIGCGAFNNCTALADVYYFGSEEDWTNIAISSDNECLTNAAIHYYCGQTFTLTWIVDGVETTADYEYGAEIAKPDDPTKQGYTFAGWGAEIPDTMPANNLTFTAAWEVNTYTVTWIVDGVETKVDYEYKAEITKPADPTKQGHTFAGWGAEIPDTMPANDLTFTAAWEINTYTVTWIVDGVETGADYDFGAAITKPADPTKQGHTFAGWGAEIPYTMPANDLTFTAAWEINTYTVTWVVDGVETSADYDFGAAITKPADPTKRGYAFIGWTPSVAEAMPANDSTYVAEFTCITTVKINNNSGTKTLNYGDGVEFTANVTDLPDGARIKWYVNGTERATGNSFIYADITSDSTVAVKIIDRNGNALSDSEGGEISDAQVIKVNVGFFQKLISFFKNLFGIGRITTQAIFEP